jgi:hypothetical protein
MDEGASLETTDGLQMVIDHVIDMYIYENKSRKYAGARSDAQLRAHSRWPCSSWSSICSVLDGE